MENECFINLCANAGREGSKDILLVRMDLDGRTLNGGCTMYAILQSCIGGRIIECADWLGENSCCSLEIENRAILGDVVA
jgi:hypothetical protein